jgi:hypothetical protein
MSREALTKLIDRMLADKAFADQLKMAPEEVVKEYDLSQDEVKALISLEPEIEGPLSEFLDRCMLKTDGDDKTESSADSGYTDEDADDWWIGSVTD